MTGDKLFRRAAAIAAISMLPCFAGAAGLGKINVLSALGQPLLAEIDLVSVSAEELPSLAARLASQDAYREANVEYPNGLGGFRFVIDKRANGQPYLKVVTNQPINEPFLDLLIELNWASGRLLREYPVLLDPPGYVAGKPQAPAIAPPQVAAPQPSVKPAPAAPAPAAPAAAAPTVHTPEAAPSQPAADKPQMEKPSAEKPAAEKPVDAKPAKAGGDKSDIYGPVRSGETLRQIAESTRGADISLEQMLVALYRENKGAFIARNMNRLKTGMILKVPSAAEAGAVDARTAKQEVIAQTADWNAYRKRVAAGAPQSQQAGQTASGTIDTKVNEATPPDAGKKDVLKLSKGQPATGKPAAGSEKLNAMQEDIASRDKALDEARGRIAQLESEIAKMRQLMELKGTPLPPAAKPSAPAPAKPPEPVAAAPAKPAEPPVPAKPVMEKPPVAAPAPAEKVPPAETAQKPLAVPEPPPAPPTDMANKPPGDEPAPKPKRPKRITPAAPPPAPQETGLIEGLLENPLIPAAGALILGLFGFLGFKQFRKRKEAQLGAFTAPGALNKLASAPAAASPASLTPAADAGNSSFLSDFDKVGAGNIDTDEVDPVAEADVYIAYGRDAQAEEILKEAIAKDPTRYEIPLKLLEIYSNRKSVPAFEATAKQLHGSIGTQHPLWSKVAEMGRKIDPDNALYAPVAMTASSERSSESSVIRAISGAAVGEKTAERVPAAMKDTLTVKEPVIEKASVDLDLDFESTRTAGVPSGDSNANMSPDTGTLDFDIGDAGNTVTGDIDFGGEKSAGGDPFVLDFDLDTAPGDNKPAEESKHAAADAPQQDNSTVLDIAPIPEFSAAGGSSEGNVDLPALDLGGIDLNLGAASGGNGADAAKGGNWQSAETKLDLARAYLEIGDKVGAVEILQEVIKEGSPEQQEEAKKLAAQA